VSDARENRVTDRPLVLVIEDERQMLRFLRPALEGNGYRVVESLTGQDGLTQASTRSPDVVLLDLGSLISTGSR
jgi:two-component system KDP operon response regulator KdpE